MINRLLIITGIVLLFCSNVYAGEKAIIFKFFNNEKYEVYLNMQDSCMSDRSMMGSISHQLLRGSYSVDAIPLQYYSVEKQDNISFFGFNITQYSITPKVKDRFKSVLWMDDENKIVKLELFDNTNTLMFAFSGFDYLDGSIGGHKHHHNMHNNQEHRDRRGNDGTKYKFKENLEFYKGFRHFHTTIFSKNVFDLSFEDGVNRFSVFVKPAESKNTTVSKIVYGNYLFSRVIDGIEYTVYGTVSFGLMEEIVNIIHENIKNIFQIVSSGNILTSEIYNK